MKQNLRQKFSEIRQQIPSHRRKEAEAFVLQKVLELSQHHRWVMSFASFENELDTTQLNSSLAEVGKLILPRVESNQNFSIFHVEHFHTELIQSTWGILEPNPILCRKALLEELSLVLVPGLAFDIANHRLGYGKGIFDRFLASIPKRVQKIGIGFKEQQSSSLLPTFPTDIPLDQLLLG